MPGRRLAERAAFVTAALGVAMGMLFLFAPIQGYCRMEATSLQPGVPATPGPTIRGQQSLIQAQTIWPMPFIAIAVWAVAPLISYVGVRRKMAPFFAPFVLLPLLITTAIALGSRSGRGVAAT